MTRFWILSRMEPSGDTVCVHVHDTAAGAEAALEGLPDVSALRDRGEAAYAVNVLRMQSRDAIKPGEAYATWVAPPTWMLFKGHEKLTAARA